MATQAQALFPEIEGPEFIRSDDVAEVAERVLRRHGGPDGLYRIRPVAQAIDDGEIHVLWLLNDKRFDAVNEEVSHDAAGKCIKAPKLWHDITGFDIAIWIRGDFWNSWEEHIREAALVHELLHVDVSWDKKGRIHVGVRKHDLEDFVDVVRYYGPIFGYAEGGAAEYVRAANLWADRTRPAPAPLRPVKHPAEEMAEAVVDQAARLQDAADESGIEITVAHKGRSATIKPKRSGPDDDTDVRPTGEINADELRGAAERDARAAELDADSGDR